MADKKPLEKLVSDQFRERSDSVATEVRILAEEGKIQRDARVYRSHPGPRFPPK